MIGPYIWISRGFGVISYSFEGLHMAEEKFGDLENVTETSHENDGTSQSVSTRGIKIKINLIFCDFSGKWGWGGLGELGWGDRHWAGRPLQAIVYINIITIIIINITITIKLALRNSACTNIDISYLQARGRGWEGDRGEVRKGGGEVQQGECERVGDECDGNQFWVGGLSIRSLALLLLKYGGFPTLFHRQ